MIQVWLVLSYIYMESKKWIEPQLIMTFIYTYIIIYIYVVLVVSYLQFPSIFKIDNDAQWIPIVGACRSTAACGCDPPYPIPIPAHTCTWQRSGTYGFMMWGNFM
jgi:hypothetical protein